MFSSSQARTSSTQPLLKTSICLLLAALVHPLMAAYGLAACILIATLGARSRTTRLWTTLAACTTALLFALCLQLLAPPESPAHQAAVTSRYYWFPSQWQWYERIGLIAPLLLLAMLLLRPSRAAILRPYRLLLQTALTLGLTASLLAAVFCRPGLATHLVACIQPLRLFQAVYLVMILFLGAFLAEYVLVRKPLRWLALILLAATPMFVAQRAIYPGSLHLEIPGRTPHNPYVAAFLWVRANTPVDALFAMDPLYINRDGEDAQNFRAIAERSTLPDYSKDGGEASITPALSIPWSRAQAAQANLANGTDPKRKQVLAPLGVTWLILAARDRTSLPCPYRNAAVQVCRLN